MTKGQFKALNTKLDSLLESTKDSSINEYSLASFKALFETINKEHKTKSNKAVESSEKMVRETTEKVAKLLSDVITDGF